MGLASLWAAFRRRLNGTTKAPVIRAPRRPPRSLDRRKLRRSGTLDPASFAAVLTGLGKHNHQARLHVFSVADFHAAVGTKWGRLAGLVEVLVDAIIRRHMDPAKDIFTRLDAETACLVFPQASRQEARTRVAAIAHDISVHLFGDKVVDGRRPQVVAANLPTAQAIAEDGSLGTDAIRKAVAEAGAPFATDSLGGANGIGGEVGAVHRMSLAAIMNGEVIALSGGDRGNRGESPAWTVLKVEARAKAADLPVFQVEGRPMMGGDAPVLVLPGHRMDWANPSAVPDWLDEQLDDRAKAAFAGQNHLAPDSNLTLVWTPTWVTRNRAIGAFHARVIRVDGAGASAREGARAYDGIAPMEALALDRFVATQAARELKNLHYRQQRMGLTVPIHWMSLAPRWRDCIRIPLEDCPAAARRKLLKLEIFGLSAQMPPAILRSLFDPLEKLGCDIMVRLPLAAGDLAASLPGVRAIGVDLCELPNDDRVGDDELFGRLDQFRAAAVSARAACYVWGVRRRPLITRIVQAGFSLVNGPGIMCDVGHPGPAVTSSPERPP
jgi:hypothetical protein